MKRLSIFLTALSLSVALSGTTIRDIQYTTDASGNSPLLNQTVTVSGIVSGEPYAFGGNIMFIHDAEGPWNGIMIDLGVHVDELVADGVIIAEGDSVTLSGKVIENSGMTQIAEVTSLVLEKAGAGCFPPTVVSTGTAAQEQYEGCLLRVKNVNITAVNSSSGEWEVNDGSGVLKISNQDMVSYFFWPEEYQSCIEITGLLNYGGAAFKVLPRLAWDIIEGPMKGESMVYTRIQRIQQVRYSDLLKTPKIYRSDFSYLVNPDTTIYVKGVVTMQTGIAYAGAGIKFILSDLHGGPWSGILSYNQDSTIYPNMLVGDLIEMSGYVGEYTTSTWSNMTEFWLVGDVNLLGVEAVPDTPVVRTGDLRHPTTAEQWGNVFIRCEDAIITDNNPQYEILKIDDGSGSVLVRADSDSLSGRGGGKAYVRPPIMTPIQSITGWIYNCYGYHTDSTTYKICPLYKEDIVLGEGPAMLLDPFRTPANVPASDQDVVVSLTVSTLRNIDTAIVHYRVNESDFTAVDMVYAGNDIWSGTVPAQAHNAIVEYYFYVVDDSGDVSILPENYRERLFAYKVLDTAPTIYDIQYTHAPLGNSPLEGAEVTFDAYVLTDGRLATTFTDNSRRGLMAVASGPGAWNGIWVLASTSSLANLREGDLVRVTGKVTENHESYYKWQKNTWVVGTVQFLLNEFPVDPTPVTLADLENDFEAYEGVLVSLDDPAEITAVNAYDITVSDGINSFLLDDDLVADSILDINYMENAVFNNVDTLIIGDSINTFTGVVMYSYSSGKVELRKAADVTYTKISGPGTSVDPLPSTFALMQNYPNPFNPVTTLRFELPVSTKLRLQIYDISGRLVEELINNTLSAGRYELQWNAAKYASGVYICRMMTPEYTATQKMLLLK